MTYTRLDASNVAPRVVTTIVNGQIGSPGSYRYYKLNVVSNNGAASEVFELSNLEFYTDDIPGTALKNDTSAIYGMICEHSSTSDPRCVYGSITPDGCSFYLDPDQWDDGAYEVRVKRGTAHEEASTTWTSYSYSGSAANSDFFEYHTTSGYYVVRIGQRDYRSDMQIEVFSTVDYTVPFDPAGVAMIAVRVPNTQISSISALFSGYAPTWDGTIWSEAETVTANPASWLRKLLLTAPNPRPIPGEIIDDAELGSFYDRCVSDAYEVNAVVSGRSVGDAMQMVASCGYAGPRAAETWGVVEDYDTSANPVTQAITPLNSRDLGTEIAIPDAPHAIQAEYFDEDDDYAVTNLTVYADGYDADTATLFEAHTYEGFTNSAKLQTRVEFDLAQPRLRSARYLREMGQEGFTIRRGHTVMLADDVLDSVVAYGVIRTVTVVSSNVESVTLDAVMPFSQALTSMADLVSAGRPMALLIRLDDGTIDERLVKDFSDTAVCSFADPFASGDVAVGQLAVCGFYGAEKRRCRVMGVEPTGIDTRVVHLADEAPELFGGTAELIEPAAGLIRTAGSGVAIMFIYRSMEIDDITTPANDYSGDPASKLTFTRALTASVWRDSVLLTTLDSGEFALDQDANSGTPLGIRIEKSETNLCLRSEEIDNANWSKTNVTVTAAVAVAPDGVTSADSVIESAINGRHAVGKFSVAVTADNTYCWSLYIKPVSGGSTRYPVMTITDSNYPGAGQRAGVEFDLDNVSSQTGVVTGANPVLVGKGIEALPNGWYRIWIAASIGGADAAIGFYLGWNTTHSQTNLGAVYTGDAVSGFYVWGAQIEDGQDWPTSYIPTTSASVTRPADVATLPTTAFDFDTDSGTFSLIARTAPGEQGVQCLAQFDDGTNDNAITISRDSGGDVYFEVTTATVLVASINVGTVVSDTRFGIAVSWAANDFSASLNGAAVVTDSSGAIPAGITTLRIGRTSSGNAWSGHVEQLRYVGPRVTDAKLPGYSAITE